METKNAPKSSCRRRFLINAPAAVVGLFVLMNGKAWSSVMQPGNYRREIDADCCIGCGTCAETCPTNAIEENNGIYSTNQDLCIGCGACDPECPVEAIEQGTLIIVPTVTPDECVSCGYCTSVCPTGAITLGAAPVINPNLCSGCGSCVSGCPAEVFS